VSRTRTDVWSRVLDGVRREVGCDRFNLWFRNTKAVGADEEELVVGVPNLFVLEWLQTHYEQLVASCAEAVTGQSVRVRFTVDGGLFRQRRREQADQEAAFLTAEARGALKQPAEALERTNPRMRLDNFVVGDCNRLAYTAACEVARAPGRVFNPLFIHGSVGLGKTHLLQGVVAALSLADRGQTCLYLSCEDFTNQYITAMRTRALDSFRRRFRRLDVLILDDIHFLTNKPATQEEFLHTFNALVDGPSKQVVLASDSHPRLIGMRSPSRRRTLTFPRQVAMFLARKHTDCSLAEIGDHFGNRDHSTVASAYRRIARLAETDQTIQQLLTRLQSLLRQRDQ